MCGRAVACREKEGYDNAIGRSKKRLPMQKLRPRPLPNTRRLPLRIGSQHKPPPAQARHVALPAKSRPQYHICHSRSVSTPSTAAPISQPIIPQPRQGRSALRFCCHFLFPLPLTVHRRVGMSASLSQRVPIRPRHRLPAPPHRLNAHLPAHHRNARRLTNHRSPTVHTTKKTDRDDPCGSSRC